MDRPNPASVVPTSLAQLLLGLLGPRHLAFDYAQLSQTEWDQIFGMAGQHRLLPLLHARIERGEIAIPLPAGAADMLKIAHRDSAIMALAHRTETFAICEMLAAEKIEAVALKGAWLAWHAYPAAAERPVRDVDLLLHEEDTLRAFKLLIAKGFRQVSPSALPPEEMVANAKHLPPLISPSGIEVELHMHLWEPQGSVEWPMPPLRDEDIFTNARTGPSGDPCLYPSAPDMIEHLIIHAAYSHRFDAGPLVLSDIAHLLESGDTDWTQFWHNAETGGWLRGAALVLALVDRWSLPRLLEQCGCPIQPDSALIEDCENLMLQDLRQKANAGFAASLSGNLSGLLTRAKRRAGGHNRGAFAADGLAEESFGRWFFRRGKELTAGLARTETRQTARQKSRIGTYLSPP